NILWQELWGQAASRFPKEAPERFQQSLTHSNTPREAPKRWRTELAWLNVEKRDDVLEGTGSGNEQSDDRVKGSVPFAVALEELSASMEPMQSLETRELAEQADEGTSSAQGTANQEQRSPESTSALLLSAYEFLLAGEYQRALTLFESLYCTLPEDTTVLEGMRLAAKDCGQLEQQARASFRLAELESNHQEAALLFTEAALIYSGLENAKAAEDCFIKALERNASNAEAYGHLYRILHERKDEPGLIRLIEQRLEIEQDTEERIHLLWSRAQYCRRQGRRQASLQALQELRKIAPKHLPSTALMAEISLSDGQEDQAAEALRDIALQTEAPEDLRRPMALKAIELFEKLHRPQEALELIDACCDNLFSPNQHLDKVSRLASKLGRWERAYLANCELAETLDSVEERLNYARITLAIQRDHLRNSEKLRAAARRVLRDAPQDTDAIQVVLEENFTDEEKARLLESSIVKAKNDLFKTPLDGVLIKRLSRLSQACHSDAWLQTSLGLASITSRLTDHEKSLLTKAQSGQEHLPQQPLPLSARETIALPYLRGHGQKIAELLAHTLGKIVEPSLEAIGVSPSMKMSPADEPEIYQELMSWGQLVGLEEMEIYRGGVDHQSILFLQRSTPTLICGEGISSPLSRAQQIRLAAHGFLVARGIGTLFSMPAAHVEEWLTAAAASLGFEVEVQADDGSGFSEKVAAFQNALSEEKKEELLELLNAWPPAQTFTSGLGQSPQATLSNDTPAYAPWRALVSLDLAARCSATRMASFIGGDVSSIRDLPECIISVEQGRNYLIEETFRFALSTEFFKWRQYVGWAQQGALRHRLTADSKETSAEEVQQ
ncbi:MAG: hypothetical protein MK135_12945, partial [Polyangiaceae bacterium]|nr:hypothetical protein [Polyangiaceae bacterium]